MNGAVLKGGALVIGYSVFIALADAITKRVAEGFAAPQLFALSSLIVAALAMLTARAVPRLGRVSTGLPGLMLCRTVFTILAALFFFEAFQHLMFAEVFLYIALMPLIAALFAHPILGERVTPFAWAALGIAFMAIVALCATGLETDLHGHLSGTAAALTGTLSMLLARKMTRREPRILAQVFWPNLGLGLASLAMLPFVWRPMGLGDVAVFLGYGVLLFGARWLTVAALRLIPAHVATPLMNVQFLWMIGLGAVIWGEVPDPRIILGATIITAAGMMLLWADALTKPVSASA